MPELHVAEDDDGRRVDRVLRNGFPNVPPGAIAGAIRRGAVRLNGDRVRGEARVQAGDRLTIPEWTDTGRDRRRPDQRTPRDDASRRDRDRRDQHDRRGPRDHGRHNDRDRDRRGPRGDRPERGARDRRSPRDQRGPQDRSAPRKEHGGGDTRERVFRAFLHDDQIRAGHWGVSIIDRSDDWLVVNKPPGLPSHGKEALDEMVRIVAAGQGWWKESLSFRPGPVHRLDVGTSGVQLFSLSTAGARLLTEELRHRRVTKMYLTVTAGYSPRSMEIDRRMAYDRSKRLAVVEPESGPPPRLRFSSARTLMYPVVTTADRRISVVAAFPKTGRTHQIRAHLASVGMPLVGDTQYGGPAWAEVIDDADQLAERKRMILHALMLSFQNPAATWNAPLPPGDYHLIRSVFGDSSGIVQRLEQIFELACTTAPRTATIRL